MLSMETWKATYMTNLLPVDLGMLAYPTIQIPASDSQLPVGPQAGPEIEENWSSQTLNRAELRLGHAALLPAAPPAERAKRVEPPLTHKPRGRPRKERIRIGEVRQRQLLAERLGGVDLEPEEGRVTRLPYRCSTCRGIGHNSAKCRNPHS